MARYRPPAVMRSTSLNTLAFWALLLSGTFAVLLWSPAVLGRYLKEMPKFWIFLLPFLLLWPAYGRKVITDRRFREEIILMGLIVLLGAVNVAGSDNPAKSAGAMRLFLSTGIPVLWAAMFLCRDERRRALFGWWCCGCLLIVTAVEMSAYFLKKVSDPSLFKIFTGHQIPYGTLLILLSPGPFLLICARSRAAKIGGWALLLLSITLILLSRKRGTLLAVAAMGLLWVYFQFPRLRKTLLCGLLAVTLALPLMTWRMVKNLDQGNISHLSLTDPARSNLHRLELYPFAWHVFPQHPVWGIGLRTFNHEKYLTDYHQWFPAYTWFPAEVQRMQTFDNMAITFLVEMGSLFTLSYLILIVVIVRQYVRQIGPLARARPEDLWRLLPLVGLGVHALTYDALLFPSINWLFHVQLGILAGFSRPE